MHYALHLRDAPASTHMNRETNKQTDNRTFRPGYKCRRETVTYELTKLKASV